MALVLLIAGTSDRVMTKTISSEALYILRKSIMHKEVILYEICKNKNIWSKYRLHHN